MAVWAELLANTKPEDIVFLREDGGINVVPQDIVNDPRRMFPLAGLLDAYGRVYLGQEIPSSAIDAAAQALPRGADTIRSVLEGHNTFIRTSAYDILKPVMRQNLLDTVARYGGAEDSSPEEIMKRRTIFGETVAYLLSQVE